MRFSKQDAQLLWIFSLFARKSIESRLRSRRPDQVCVSPDYLTGLRTRGYFEQQLDLEIKRAERKVHSSRCSMVDIDRFKILNDQCGHHVGDQVLREVASLLGRDMRDVDTHHGTVARSLSSYLPETDEQGALHVAQRIRQTIEQAHFYPVERITISVGDCGFGQDTRFKRELIRVRRRGSVPGKHRGRNQVVVYRSLRLIRKEIKEGDQKAGGQRQEI